MKKIEHTDIFRNNWKIFNEKFPQQAEVLEKQTDIFPLDYELCISEDHLINVSIRLTNFGQVRLYENDHIVETLKSNTLSITLEKNDLLMCIGMGLGYVPLIAARMYEDMPKIVIVERFPEMFKLALSLVDLTDLLSYENLDIYLGSDFSIDEMLTRCREYHYSGICQRNVPVAYRLIFGEKFHILENEIDEKIRFMMSAWNTTSVHGEMILKNSIENLSSLFSGSVINSLKDKFKGLPAVCVASGPSLEKDLPVLKEIKDSVLILACDSAVKALVKEGIIPHVIFAVDYMKSDFDKIRDSIKALKETILVYLMDANTLSVQGFPGIRRAAILSKNPFLKGWLIPEFGIDFELPGIITSNSDAVVLTAIQSGADPIILSGMDLAFSNGKDHANGAMSISIKQTKEMVKTDGVAGFPVISLPALVSGKLALENNIKTYSQNFIDSSLDGAVIKGTQIKSIQEVKDTIVKDNIHISDIIKQIDWSSPFKSEEISAAMNRLENGFIQVKKRSVESLVDLCRTYNDALKNHDTKRTTEKVKKLISAYKAFNEKNSFFLRMIKNIRYDDQLSIDRMISNLHMSAKKSLVELNRETLMILKIYYKSVYLYSRRLQRLISGKKKYFIKINQYKEALKNDPKDKNVQLGLARCHASENCIWLAQDAYEACLENYPKDETSIRELAELLLKNEMYQQVEALLFKISTNIRYEKTVRDIRYKMQEKLSALLVSASKNCIKENQMTKEEQGRARRDVMAFLSVYPDDKDALHLLDRINQKQKTQEQQMKNIIGFSYEPEQIRYLLAMAKNFVSKKEYEKAVGIYEGLISQFPHEEPLYRMMIGDIRLEQKDFQSAAWQYAKSKRAGMDVSVYKIRMRFLDSLKRGLALYDHKTTIRHSIIIPHITNNEILKNCLTRINAAKNDSCEIIIVCQNTKKISKDCLDFINNQSGMHCLDVTENPSSGKALNSALAGINGAYISIWDPRLVTDEKIIKIFQVYLDREPEENLFYPHFERNNKVVGNILPEDGIVLAPGEWCFGIFPTMTRKMIENIGLLDEDIVSFPAIWQDFVKRAILAGYIPMTVDNIRIKIEANIFTDDVNSSREIEEKWDERNLPSFIQKQIHFKESLERARALARKGAIDKAVSTLVRELEVDPLEVQVYLRISELLIEEERYTDALAALNGIPRETLSIIKKGNQNSMKALNLGYAAAYLCIKDVIKAEEHIERVFAITPSSAEALCLKGILFLIKNDVENAVEYLMKAIDKSEGIGIAYAYLGAILWEKGNEEEGLSFTEKAFRLCPEKSEIMTIYHQKITDTGEYAKAIGLFQSALKSFPNNKKLCYLLVDLLIKNKQIHDAMAKIEESIVRFGVDDGIVTSALAVRSMLLEDENRDLSKTRGKNNKLAVLHIDSEINEFEKYLFQLKKTVDAIDVHHNGNAPESARMAMVFGARVINYAEGEPKRAVKNDAFQVADQADIIKWISEHQKMDKTQLNPLVYPNVV